MANRAYRLGRRQQGIDATRARVVEASHALFAETGFHQTTVEGVAQRAGVSRATVYHQFGSKAGLLDAVISEAMASGIGSRMRRMREHADAAKALRLYVPDVCRFWASEYELFKHLFAAAEIDPDARAHVEAYDGRRRELVIWLAKRLADQGYLREGVRQRQAVDTIWMLTSFRSFDHLHVRSGMSVRAAGALLAGLAATVLRDGAGVAGGD